MGCAECAECKEKFEEYSAEEFAGEIGAEPDYDTCPACIVKQNREAQERAELEELRGRVKALQKEVLDERSKRIAAERRVGAASTSEAPVAKKQKTETSSPPPRQVWVLTHADLPENPHTDGVPSCEVIGAYLSEEKAQEAMAEYLEERGFEEGQYIGGYHAYGRGESYIGVKRAPVCLH